MSDSLISVIVPVYNSEQTLHRCIDSILGQTYRNFELLLINDGSKDCSGEICDEYARKDNRVKVFHKENGGVSSARNVGLVNARGEWVSFVDSDDYLQQGFLESMNLYESSDLVIGNSIWLNDKDEKLFECDIPKGVFLKNEILPQYLYSAAFNVPWGKLFKSDVIATHNIRFNSNMRVAEDLLFVYQYLLHINRIHAVNGLLHNSNLVHHVPGNFVEKYSMTTAEAAQHYSFVWMTYKQLNIRCEVFEEKFLMDIFELCKRDAYKNPSPWYENVAVKEAYRLRTNAKGGLKRIKAFGILNMKLYKFRFLWRKA